MSSVSCAPRVQMTLVCNHACLVIAAGCFSEGTKGGTRKAGERKGTALRTMQAKAGAPPAEASC